MDSSAPSPIKHFQVNKLSVRVYNSSLDLATDAARLAASYLRSLLGDRERVRVILATGNSQLQFLDRIANATDLDWSRVVFLHLDEYLGITAHHPGSFRYYLKQEVEQRITQAQFHYIEGDALEPLAECNRYRQLIQQEAIDLCLLGIGENGHLAFNEPSVADFKDSQDIKIVKLESRTRQQQVKGGYFSTIETVPQYAYTLTIPTICAAKKIICLAGGKRKAEIVKTILRGKISASVPASILQQQPQATLFLDRDSACLL